MSESVTPIDSLREFLDHVRGIKKSAVFQKWKEICEGQIKGRTDEVLQPCTGQDLLVKQEYMKGEIAGMMAAVMHWDYLEANVETELNRLLEEHTDESDGGTP